MEYLDDMSVEIRNWDVPKTHVAIQFRNEAGTEVST